LGGNLSGREAWVVPGGLSDGRRTSNANSDHAGI
jgi:hypothetical protein